MKKKLKLCQRLFSVREEVDFWTQVLEYELKNSLDAEITLSKIRKLREILREIMEEIDSLN